jgi:hypothetical protein
LNKLNVLHRYISPKPDISAWKVYIPITARTCSFALVRKGKIEYF